MISKEKKRNIIDKAGKHLGLGDLILHEFLDGGMGIIEDTVGDLKEFDYVPVGDNHFKGPGVELELNTYEYDSINYYPYFYIKEKDGKLEVYLMIEKEDVLDDASYSKRIIAPEFYRIEKAYGIDEFHDFADDLYDISILELSDIPMKKITEEEWNSL
jgi:hypothetical protein